MISRRGLLSGAAAVLAGATILNPEGAKAEPLLWTPDESSVALVPAGIIDILVRQRDTGTLISKFVMNSDGVLRYVAPGIGHGWTLGPDMELMEMHITTVTRGKEKWYGNDQYGNRTSIYSY